MKRFCLLLTVLVCTVSFGQKTRWIDPFEEGAVLHGQGWAEIEQNYQRLPDKAHGLVREPVWKLSRNSAGLSLVFRSNSPSIYVSYQVEGGYSMYHMPSTGVSGVDMYAIDKEGELRWCGANFPASFKDTITYRYDNITYYPEPEDSYEFHLYLPMYNTVKWLKLGVPEGYSLDFCPKSDKKPIVAYGTSILQGACPSRPGMAFTNIIERELQRPVVNLGFSGNGKLEGEMFDLLGEIDAGLYIIDCIANNTGEDAPVYERTTDGVRKLRALHKDCPILLVEGAGSTNEKTRPHPTAFDKANEKLLNAYNDLVAEGVGGLYYMAKEEIGLRMDEMVEGVHPNDLGMRRYADAYEKKILRILPKEDKAAVDRAERYTYPSEPEVLASIQDWRDMKFGMIIHWGTFSQIGAIESWSLCPEDIYWMHQPEWMSYNDYREMYENLYRVFNPVYFNPSEWAAAARDAGMKYVIFTTKHHDGFNMYDTALSDYRITSPDCPFHSDERADITKEVFDAFRAEGLRTGVYYSAIDWHSNDFWWDFFPPKDRYVNYDPAKHPGKWEAYRNFVVGQIDELTSGKYGDIQTVWIDHTSISDRYEAPYPWEEILQTVRRNQPSAMLVGRGVGGKYENYVTPEQTIPDHIIDTPWESCFTMTRSWAYRPGFQYKSTATILGMLVKIVSRGGNLLLNAAPGPDGCLEDEAYQRLKEIGDWMSVNSEGIYGTRPYALEGNPNLYCTTKDGAIYAFYVPDEEGTPLPESVLLPGISPRKVTLLGSSAKLKVSASSGDGAIVAIPESLRRNLPCEHIWCLKVTE